SCLKAIPRPCAKRLTFLCWAGSRSTENWPARLTRASRCWMRPTRPSNAIRTLRAGSEPCWTTRESSQNNCERRGDAMKFVCLNCETYMNFEKVEKPSEGSLGVFFGCPSCGAKFSMVTNPGETQMVSSLGVKLGGRTVAAEPFEMTRGTLKDEALAGSGQMAAYLNEKIQSGQPVSASAGAEPMAPNQTKP